MNGISVDINHLKKGEVSLGTSIMAVRFKDGVILGADSRTTTGTYIANRVSDKLTQIHDTIYCCRSGSAADTQAVADIVKYYLQMYAAQLPAGEKPTTEVAANTFQELCYSNKDNLSAGIICAGYDAKSGGAVYSIPIGGSIHKQEYAIAGSGSTFIYGWCDKNFRPQMEKDECVSFIRSALAEAIKWDRSSGGVVRMVILTKDGVERRILYPEDYQGA
ncbi:putative proteasome subunit beta type-1 [Clavispora lusitaniae]|uniref:Proteasome subunit beta type-1 n=1 Tax=Clavispora lusitaniae TaxID=36911 RepID=A0ACD0WPW7_CLALS|nr:putative proteasome subunit beta type-1 [Clavispora lusitaniae]QFZ35104.1 putative proteasome subunit beta type-1 [Clavispora lusitaniae]QFZ40789.1 putative proteasome subunit beta type-1 [Clavispora lusitaniae]QFZ46469.1 putative proteasome subunit beta type-1 [Clavispora lusitaniae]QFZ52131.1 putative proteasome subunit beta type-1 [Clavispora lusitaniae]